jgi:hypothetical protein
MEYDIRLTATPLSMSILEIGFPVDVTLNV